MRNFSERRLGEVRRTFLPGTPVKRHHHKTHMRSGPPPHGTSSTTRAKKGWDTPKDAPVRSVRGSALQSAASAASRSSSALVYSHSASAFLTTLLPLSRAPFEERCQHTFPFLTTTFVHRHARKQAALQDAYPAVGQDKR
jgi:hypothetical protein